jgi:hypothetical protein
VYVYRHAEGRQPEGGAPEVAVRVREAPARPIDTLAKGS